MTIAGAAKLFSPTPVTARSGGILSVAEVIDVNQGDHRLLGAQYETQACLGATLWDGTDFCTTAPELCGLSSEDIADALEAIPNPKPFDSTVSLIEGTPFVAVAGVECDLLRQEEALRRATAHFDYGEAREVDAAMATVLAAIDTQITAAATPVKTAVGIMEEWIAARYGGVPTLIFPIATLPDAIGEVITRDPLAGRLVSYMGSPVAATVRAGAGAPDPSGTAFVTGRIIIIRGPKRTYSVPPMQLSDDVCLPARALVERIYVPLIECVVGSLTAYSAPSDSP